MSIHKGALFLFFLANALFQLWLYRSTYLSVLAGNVVQPPPADRALFLIYCLAFLTSVAVLLTSGALYLSRFVSRGSLRLILVVVLTGLNAALFIDSKVFPVLGVHVYGQVITTALRNAEFNREASIDRGAILSTAGWILAIVVGEVLLVRGADRLWRKLAPRQQQLAWRWMARVTLCCMIGWWGLAAAMHARILGPTNPAANILPLDEVLPKTISEPAAVKVTYAQDLSPPRLGRRPDILFIAVESLRSDAFSAELTPNLVRLAREGGCIQSLHHYSGSHVSELGVFSLLYGLNTYHYAPFALRGIPSFPLQVLRQNGYLVTGASASVLSNWNQADFMVQQLSDYREFNADEAFLSDQRMVAWVRALHDGRPRGAGPRPPLFLFLFFNSTHTPYSYPPESETYRPVVEPQWIHHLSERKFLALKEPIYNRYKNSVGYVDRLFGELLDLFREERERGDLVIVLTGDHGEEFWEHGLYGHVADRFENERTQVPLLLCLPGGPGGTRALTSHVDLMPTLLDYAQMSPPLPAARYASGLSLLRAHPDRYVVVGGVGFPFEGRELALITAQSKFWLKQDKRWLDHFRVTRVTDLSDRPVLGADPTAGLAAPLGDFNRNISRFMQF